MSTPHHRRLRVEVRGDPGLCPSDAGVECRAVPPGAVTGPPAADLVIIDLDAAGERAEAEIGGAADPERGVLVLAVSRDPSRGATALAAGATDFALLPRDAAWLRAAVIEERDRRLREVPTEPGEREHDRLIVRVPPGGLSFDEYERRVVEHALDRAGWNRSRAARELGISRPRLLRKIERYGLAEPRAEPEPPLA